MLTCSKKKAAIVEPPQPPFRILDLPAELVDNVARELEGNDLISLRRTCRSLNAHSANAFGLRFFGHLIVILHPLSLTTLFEICMHPVLWKYVWKVTVSGERIGHAMAPLKNEHTHKDLQTSVERSGMDVLILSTVFKELKNLRIIAINDRSFYQTEPDEDEDVERCEIGISCGRKCLFEGQTPAKKAWDRGNDNGFNRVYGLAMQALCTAQVHERLDLNLEFWNSCHTNATFKYFNLDSESWIGHLSQRVRYVSTINNMDPEWLTQLFSLATGITKIELSQNHGFLRLSKGLTISLFFPNLRHLNTTEVMIDHREWVVFLRLHASSLKSMVIQSVGLQGGTWDEPLGVLETMPGLEELWLSMLLSPVAYSYSSMTYWGPTRPEPSYVSLESHEDVGNALGAMCGHLETVFTDEDIEDGDGKLYPYMVVYDRAYDYLIGDIVFRDGHWVLEEDGLDLSNSASSQSE